MCLISKIGDVYILEQCEQLETEFSGLLHQRRTMFRSCLDLLHTYATVTSLVSFYLSR